MVASTMDRASGSTRGWVGAVAGLALLFAATAPAAAQQDYARFSVDPRAGVGFAVGDLADSHEVGFSGGLGVAYKVHPNIAVRGDFDISVLDDESPQFGLVLAPTLTMVHYYAGLEFDFGPPDFQDLPLSFRWNVGGGGTSMSASRDFPDDGPDIDFSETYPSVNSGVKIGYRFNRSIELFVGGQLFLTFADEAEIAELVQRVPQKEPYGTVWSAPVTLGLKASFQ